MIPRVTSGTTPAEPHGSGGPGPRCHDLIRIPSERAIPGPRPAWVDAALREAPYVVVRRCAPVAGTIPVGVRGRGRSQRWATCLDEVEIVTRIAPEDLVRQGSWQAHRRADGVPALRALPSVGAWAEERGWLWGPTGAVGFELASGWPATTAHSDLDILIRAPVPLARTEGQIILRELERLPVRIDVQLDTPAGLVALAEYARSGKGVMARGAAEVRIVEDPWADRAGSEGLEGTPR